jgi:topoisomerase IA-like protein
MKCGASFCCLKNAEDGFRVTLTSAMTRLQSSIRRGYGEKQKRDQKRIEEGDEG